MLIIEYINKICKKQCAPKSTAELRGDDKELFGQFVSWHEHERERTRLALGERRLFEHVRQHWQQKRQTLA